MKNPFCLGGNYLQEMEEYIVNKYSSQNMDEEAPTSEWGMGVWGKENVMWYRPPVNRMTHILQNIILHQTFFTDVKNLFISGVKQFI